MAWYHRILGIDKRFTQPDPDRTRGQVFSFRLPVAGVHVTEETALTYSTVYACVRVISDTIAGLPWQVYKKTGDKREVDETNEVNYIIQTEPNVEMDSFTFKNTLTAHTLLWGNGYAEIERAGGGHPIALWPITPDRVEVKRDASRNLFYEVKDDYLDKTAVPASDMLHIKGLSFDGRIGYSVVSLAKNAMSLGLAMEEFGSAFFGNGATLGLVMEHPGKLNQKAKEHLKQEIKEKYSGSKNAHNAMILQEGMKVSTVGVPPEDAQFLQSRQFQAVEICRWFRVPPHKVADLTRATFSNIEHQSTEFVTDTIMPWVVRFEKEADRKLLNKKDTNVYTKMNLNSLLRGDTNARANFYKTMNSIAVLSINEIREKEDLNPIEGGDARFVPLNMVTLDRAVKEGTTAQPKTGAPQPPPASPSPVKEPEEPEDPEGMEEVGEKYVPLIRDGVRRVLNKEFKALLRASQKYANDKTRLSGWCLEFYSQLENEFVEAMTPGARLLAEVINGNYDCVYEYAEKWTNNDRAFDCAKPLTVDEIATLRAREVVKRILEDKKNGK